MHRSRLITAFSTAAIAMVTGLTVVAQPAHATIDPASISALNEKKTKYAQCPDDSPCYTLETRVIRAKVNNTSEATGDENYILPLYALIDGMGVDPSPNAAASDSQFRVNMVNNTWRTFDSGRGSNLGGQWYDRSTSAWSTLASSDRSSYQWKNHQYKDYVIPLDRTSFGKNDGLLLTTTFMEHDFAKEADLDKMYLDAARGFQASLVAGADASTVRKDMMSVPTYYTDAALATGVFVARALPKVAAVVAAAETGGASAAVVKGATDVSDTVDMFADFWNGIKALDTDDRGSQVSAFLRFKDLPLNKEKEITVTGITDKGALNEGRFTYVLGVKLVKVRDAKTKNSFQKAAAAAIDSQVVAAGNPTWVSTPTVGAKPTFVPGTFAITNVDNQTALTIHVISRPYYCSTKTKAADPITNRCPTGLVSQDLTPGGSGSFTLGGGAAISGSAVPANRKNTWAVMATSYFAGGQRLKNSFSSPLKVVAAGTTAPRPSASASARPSVTPSPVASSSSSAAASATAAPAGKLTVTSTAVPRIDGNLTVGGKIPLYQGTFSVTNGTNAAATAKITTKVFYCASTAAARTPLSCTDGGVVNETAAITVAQGASTPLGGAGGTAGTIPASASGKFAVILSSFINTGTGKTVISNFSTPTKVSAAAVSPSASSSASASTAATTFVAAAPVAGDCPRISGTQATALTCPTMTVVGGGNAKASSKIKVTAGTYDTGVQRQTRQVFLYSCTAQDRTSCTQIGYGVNVDANGEYTFDLATLGGAALIGKYIHAESFVQNNSTFVGLGTFHASPKFIGVNP